MMQSIYPILIDSLCKANPTLLTYIWQKLYPVAGGVVTINGINGGEVGAIPGMVVKLENLTGVPGYNVAIGNPTTNKLVGFGMSYTKTAPTVFPTGEIPLAYGQTKTYNVLTAGWDNIAVARTAGAKYATNIYATTDETGGGPGTPGASIMALYVPGASLYCSFAGVMTADPTSGGAVVARFVEFQGDLLVFETLI